MTLLKFYLNAKASLLRRFDKVVDLSTKHFISYVLANHFCENPLQNRSPMLTAHLNPIDKLFLTVRANAFFLCTKVLSKEPSKNRNIYLVCVRGRGAWRAAAAGRINHHCTHTHSLDTFRPPKGDLNLCRWGHTAELEMHTARGGGRMLPPLVFVH